MGLHVSESAAEWYKKELGLKPGDYVRFFARYSAGGGLHPGFSLGIAVDSPQHPVLCTESGGIVFYMEERDEWYLKGYNIEVSYLPEHDDIVYEYSPA